MNRLFREKVSSITNIGRDCWYSFFLFLGAFAILRVFQIKIPVNGDTYVYAESIISFAGPIIHYGYFVIGAFFYAVLQKFGMNALQTVTFMSIFFGSVCVASMYLFSIGLTKDRFQSLLAALILMFSGIFWFFAEHGEVYVPQLGLILLAVLFTIKKRPFISSILFLFAIWVTPTSILTFPPILYLGYQKGFSRRQFTWFILPVVLWFVGIFLWDFKRTLEIIRWAMYPPVWVVLENITFKQGIFLGLYQLLLIYSKPFGLFFLAMLFGSFALYRSDRRVFLLMLSFLAPFLAYIFNVGLLSGDHLIVTYIVVSFLASYGLCRLFEMIRATVCFKWVAAFCLILIHASLSYALFINPNNRDSLEGDRVALKFASVYEPGGITVSEYNFGMVFWYLTHPEQNFYLLTGRPNNYLSENCPDMQNCIARLQEKFWINLPHFPGFVAQPIDFKELMRGRPIYFMDRTDWPTDIVTLLLPKAMLDKRKTDIPQLSRFKADLEKALEAETEFEKIIDSPLYPVYSVHIVAKKENPKH